MLAFRDRAKSVWNYAQDHYMRQPGRYLEIPEGMESEDSARLVESELSKLQKSGIQFTDEHSDIECEELEPHIACAEIKFSRPVAVSLPERPVPEPTTFAKYYEAMFLSGDIDPAFPMINEIIDRYELSLEQQYWLAFIYGVVLPQCINVPVHPRIPRTRET